MGEEVNPWAALLIAAITGLGTTVLLARAKRFLASRNILDVPNHRSSHTRPTLRGAGLGIVAGLLVGLTSGVPLVIGEQGDLSRLLIMGLTVGAMSAVGFVEDLRGLRVATRIGTQASILALATVALLITGSVQGVIGPLAWLGGIFYVNAANFMDGANGISSLHGTITGAYYAFVGVLLDSPGMIGASIALSIAFLSFLPWNIGRARVFMGDVGSYALGAGAWALALWAISLGTSLITALAPLVIYTTDVLFTLVKRAVRRAPLHEAHHEHAYQRLMPHFSTHTVPTGIAAAATLACTLFGLLAALAPESRPWAIGFTLVVACTYFICPGMLPAVESVSDEALVDEHA